MAAKTVLTMEESIRLVQWGKENCQYMCRNPRNNIRRKIKTDTGIDAGLTKIIELEKMYKVTKKHGGKRPAGKNYSRLLLDLNTVADALINLLEWNMLSFSADGTLRMRTEDGNDKLVRLGRNMVDSSAAVKEVIKNLRTIREQIRNERPTNTSEGKE